MAVLRYRDSRTGEDIVVSLKRHSLSWGVGDRYAYFDAGGRPLGASREGRTYQRGLDGRIVEKWSEPGPPRRRMRRVLPQGRNTELLNGLAATARWLLEGLEGGALIPVTDGGGLAAHDEAAVRGLLARIARHDARLLAREERRYLRVYKPVSILPPDQYLAVVVQATEGCTWNRCRFCVFYRDRPFRAKDPPELARHIRAVKRFLGPGILLRRSVFLADANALVLPTPVLVEMLREIHRHLPVGVPDARGWSLQGVYSFLDVFTGVHKTARDFAVLARLNMSRVYLGLETGHDPLLRLLDKPGSAREALTVVRAVKEGGMAVGVIVMTGIGGQPFWADHVRDTRALLTQLPLDEGDIVYLSPFRERPESGYGILGDRVYPGLSEEEMELQAEQMAAPLRQWVRGPRIARYDINEFVY